MASPTLPVPDAFINSQASSCTDQATPDTPMPLPPTAPIVPATWVP